MKKIFVLTGEPSGDKLASTVINKLKQNHSQIILKEMELFFQNQTNSFSALITHMELATNVKDTEI